MKVKAFDFFCGAGGLTRGLLDAGINVIAGFDNDPTCKKTYEFNNEKARFHHIDIRKLTLDDLIKAAGTDDFSEMLFAGCAPCQPFSKQRKSKHRHVDATLLLEFGRLIEEAQPGMVFVENVPGIAKVAGYSAFRRFLKLLERNGYKYVFQVIDAKEYGVPQTRKRLVLIAMRGFRPTIPKPKFGSDERPFRTVRWAISHFPEIGPGESHPDVPNHVTAAITDLNLERLRYTPHDGGDRRSWPKHLQLNCHGNGFGGYTDVYGRLYWDAPAPTLTSRCNSISNGRYGHPEQDRAMSLREAAAIQSFPDHYVFFDANKNIALQVGNAVPVKMAQELGKHICYLWEQKQEVHL